jgi:hypothetical protein
MVCGGYGGVRLGEKITEKVVGKALQRTLKNLGGLGIGVAVNSILFGSPLEPFEGDLLPETPGYPAGH